LVLIAFLSCATALTLLPKYEKYHRFYYNNPRFPADIETRKWKTGCNGHAEGAEYKREHIVYKCQHGASVATGCYVDEQRPPLVIGEDVVEASKIHRCYQLGQRVTYINYRCGQKGAPPCSPPSVPETGVEAELIQSSGSKVVGVRRA
ncbi:hypothetical protein AAVH_37485, partial [Aphelenchoides avenae]